MPDPNITDGYLDTGWLTEPAPGTAAHALMAASDAEVHQEPTGTGRVALAWAQDRIERNTQ